MLRTGQTVVGETVAPERVQLRGGLVVNADVKLIVIENAVAAGGKIVDKPALVGLGNCCSRATACVDSVVGNQIACEVRPCPSGFPVAGS